MMPRPGPTRRATLAAAAAIALAATAGATRAETYPVRPIRFVVAFGAGSGSDIRARLLGERIAADWGQPVVVENRGGANGFLAAEAVARARPDGYTLLFTSNTTHAANPVLFRRLPYDPIRDFEPVALLGTTPLIMVINNDLPVRDVREFIAYARANPGRLNYASGNTSSRIGAEMFKVATGTDLVYVNYRSNPQAILDVSTGAAQVMFSDALVGIPQVREGRVRALAITGPEPVTALPGVPTMAEAAGLPGFAISSWSALFAPAGTPRGIVAQLNAKVVEILARPEMRTRMEAEGTVPATHSPDELARFVREEIARWGEVVQRAGIEVEG